MSMNFDYFDVIGSTEPKIDIEDEKVQLQNIADNIGSYLYSYTDEAQKNYGTDNKDHLGIIAQDLLKVPGLSSAVNKDEYGNYVVDAQKIALAALGLVAALARATLPKTFYKEEEIENGNASEELSKPIQNAITDDTAATTTTAAGEETADNDDANVDATETITNVTSNE